MPPPSSNLIFGANVSAFLSSSSRWEAILQALLSTQSVRPSCGADVVIIDTAGRLHNKVNLMNELSKIKNVMHKVVPEAPDEVLLVLDGSTGRMLMNKPSSLSRQRKSRLWL